MAVRGIDHIDLRVGNLEESVAAYEQLGFQVIARTTHAGGAVELQLPGRGRQSWNCTNARRARSRA